MPSPSITTISAVRSAGGCNPNGSCWRPRSSQISGPVQISWSREQDIRYDAFRYHNHSAIRVGVDDAGTPVSFEHHVVGPSIMAWFLPAFTKDGVDLDIVNYASGSYEWPNHRVGFVRREPPGGLLVGNWRGVGETRNCFVVESVLDELAHAAGQDPVHTGGRC